MTAPVSPSKKSYAGSLVSGLVSTASFVLIVLVLLEGLSRLFLDSVPEVRVEARVIPKSTEPISLELEGVPDRGELYQRTRSGLRLRPHTHAVLKNERLSGLTIDIRTNSLGYRGPEIDTREGTRILFLGDSITFANYLPEEETFVHLTRVLGAAKGHSWNTINAGVGTISTLHGSTARTRNHPRRRSRDSSRRCGRISRVNESRPWKLAHKPASL